jgi:hypothetical protein
MPGLDLSQFPILSEAYACKLRRREIIMKRLALTLLILTISTTALAESWVCIVEASAGVTTSAPFTSNDVELGRKYLVMVENEGRDVSVKEFGSEYICNLDCEFTSKAIMCKARKGSYGSEFHLNRDDKSFTSYSILKGGDEALWHIVSSGKCDLLD